MRPSHPTQLEALPGLGEGFILRRVVRILHSRREECHFWATHAGAELDLMVVSGGTRLGFEIKGTDSPAITPSIRSAMEALRLDRPDVIHAGGRSSRYLSSATTASARPLTPSFW